jgi:hypothetical protein
MTYAIDTLRALLALEKPISLRKRRICGWDLHLSAVWLSEYLLLLASDAYESDF